jgi:chemotaxis protein MotB
VARKKRQESHLDERWLITYADTITLLMVLFVVLFAMSSLDASKFTAVSQSLREAFSGPLPNSGAQILEAGSPNLVVRSVSESVAPEQPVPDLRLQVEARATGQVDAEATQKARAAIADAQAADQRELEQLEAAKSLIDRAVREANAERYVNTSIDREGLRVRLVTDEVLFPVGSAELRPELQPLLRIITRAVDPITPNPIRVFGHTDALPFPDDPYGNERLSLDRAWTVMRFMLDNGLTIDQHPNLSAGGFGDRQPLAPNAPDGRGDRNRRVEILVLRIDRAARALREAQGPLGVNPSGVETTVSVAQTP